MANLECASIIAENSQEMFKIARSMIEHEDSLAVDRTTGLLQFQGFLFTALGVGLNLLKDRTRQLQRVIVAGLGAIMVAGFVSPIVVAHAVMGAEDQIHVVAAWWDCSSFAKDYPKIIGDLAQQPFPRRGYVFIGGLSVVWSALFGFLWWAVLRRDTRPTAYW